MFSGVSNSIGHGGMNDESDIFATKAGLAQTGDFNPMWDLYDHKTSEPEKRLGNTIETFQGRFGLKKDGLMTPGGPTETTLKAETAKVAREDVGLPKAPDPIALKAPVGLNQSNRPEDIAPVQTAFQALSQPTFGLSQLAGSPPTLETFQSKFGLKPDGIMLPGGPTEQTLNRLAGPIMAANRRETISLNQSRPVSYPADAPTQVLGSAKNTSAALSETTGTPRKPHQHASCKEIEKEIHALSEALDATTEVRDNAISLHRKVQELEAAFKEGVDQNKAKIALSDLGKVCDIKGSKQHLIPPQLRTLCKVVDSIGSLITVYEIMSPDQALQQYLKVRAQIEQVLLQVFAIHRTEAKKLESLWSNLDRCRKDTAP